MSVRVGLVGTGTWARDVHAPGLASTPGVEFGGVWGRSEAHARELAEHHGVPAYPDIQKLFRAVDAVSFAVPPGVQVEHAPTAAALGRLLLLEKPLALDPEGATALQAAISRGGAAALVFVTRLFDPPRARWLQERRTEGWSTAHAEFVSAAMSTGRFRSSVWRQQWGALWDIGPHVLSQLQVVLGPVEAVRVDEAVPEGSLRLRFTHPSGESTAHLDVHAARDELVEWVRVGAVDGGRTSPPSATSPVGCYRNALTALVTGHHDALAEASVDAGLATVQTLAAAQALIDARRFGELTPVTRATR